jgi:hypothetical protein
VAVPVLVLVLVLLLVLKYRAVGGAVLCGRRTEERDREDVPGAGDLEK